MTAKDIGHLHKKQSRPLRTVIVIILIIALIGSLGLIYWQNFIATTPNSETQTNTPPSLAVTEEVDDEPSISADWLVYESQNKKYSVSVPDG